MPSKKIMEQKKAQVAELSEQIKNSVAGVLVSYKGINVANDTKLRKELREKEVKYSVVKNSLLRLAFENAGLGDLITNLEGPTALALSENDLVAAAKILCDYAANDKSKTFEIKAGFVEGRAISKVEVDNLAKLPSKEVLVAQVLGGLNAPITGFVGVLNANLRGLVVALNAIAEKKSA